MERFGEGDNVVLGYRHPKSFENTETARYNSSDMDFNDVFGGPPRRYSMTEMRMRYSFNETVMDSEDDAVFTTRDRDNHHPWSGLNEKPVFGEESVSRRRYVSGDFFDDIFKGDESYGSPRRTDRDPFGSAPGSRVLSPARPLPPRAEPFATSFPAQFSLPAKLTTSMDSPVFASGNSSLEKNKDGISNGMSNPQISKASFTKFLNRAINGKSEARGDHQNYRQSPLSREDFLTSEESPHVIKSDEKGSKLKEDAENVKSPNDGNQFHFSIYKWAGVGVPLMIPLRAGKSSKVEIFERFSSSNGRIESNNLDNERSECDKMDSEPASASNHTVLSNAESKSLKVEREKDDKGSNKEGPESYAAIKEANLEVPESNFLNGVKNPAPVGKSTVNNRTEELLSSQKVEIHNLQKEVRTSEVQVAKPEMKPLRAVLSDKVEAQGNSNDENETAVKDTRAAKAVHISNDEKKNDARRKSSNKVSVNKDGLPGSPTTPGNSRSKIGVKGKVKDFVKMFNQETIGKMKSNVDTRSQSSRWKIPDNYGIDNEGSRVHKMNEKVQPAKIDNTPNAFTKADENPNKDSVKNPSKVKTSNHRSSRSADQKDASSFPESFHGTSKVTSRNTEDINQENFTVEELCHDQDKGLQTTIDPEDIQASNAKIQQWAHGRKGNIRSLLSTLQYVLWPESGWKPVPLANIIEGTAVKRTYQRALLCLHPDKLQQKDASPHQKYIAEKVFDILQESWDHFNSLGGI